MMGTPFCDSGLLWGEEAHAQHLLPSGKGIRERKLLTLNLGVAYFKWQPLVLNLLTETLIVGGRVWQYLRIKFLSFAVFKGLPEY